MSAIEKLPSNEIIVMTVDLIRLFKALGCNPRCHACFKFILGGDGFRLATYRHWEDGTVEVMVCPTCNPEDVSKPMLKGGGCWRVNGKVSLCGFS